jgi:Fe-S-cluster-containing hydrogenase component 2
MGTNWGLFFCNCRGSLPVDRERLVLPVAPSVLSFGSDPEIDIPEFATRARAERVDRVLISCCMEAGLCEKFFSPSGPAPKVHLLNLKNTCFLPHGNSAESHAKATRLLRAAMDTADETVQPVYNRLATGNRILIAADDPQGAAVAQRLRYDGLRPFFVIAPTVPTVDVSQTETYSGRVVEIKGRLGEFHVLIESVETPHGGRRELSASQVVIISHHKSTSFKRRTGLYLLDDPTEADLTRTVDRVRDLTGEFLKPVHVLYETDKCAGGVADQEACGSCITACPYHAISRDPANHLRTKIDHMACEGCGACVSACPTTSMRFAEPSAGEIYARMAALLAPPADAIDGERWVILFHCGEQGRRVLEKAAKTALEYPATILPLEVPCLRYVSEANMLAAFRLGAAGVGLLGCEACQHGERELLRHKYDFCRITLDAFVPDQERLCLITAGDDTAPQAIEALTRFADSLAAAPVRWDGKRLPQRDNREVIADAIAVFIEQTKREPGRRGLEAGQPFAFAEVAASGCTMCRSCVNVCPVHAFTVDDSSLSLQFQHISCVACGLCEKLCPENVITLRREICFDRNALERRTAVQDHMVSCTNCGKPFINRKALEMVEARLLSLDSLLDTFAGGRRNLLRMCPDCRAAVAMLEVEKGWKP